MNDKNIAIRVKNLGKKYTIGGPKEQYLTLRDAIVNTVKAPFKHAQTNEGFWALKDVSFDVEQGDVVGIIGRNGAGKSTLLKILSRITAPTEGTVELHGRVGSLLEVGTGFHPELTGRENIFLSGSILGMKKREINSKMDEIVKFSEIEKFLDTPVKRYSSGMYVRLAFAVAAHMDTEILVVDEVLAVGDAQFQKKCLGKMGQVSKNEGRTVLFVSHQMGTITQLCKSAILLKNGQISQRGLVSDVVAGYMNQVIGDSVGYSATQMGSRDMVIAKAEAFDENGNPSSVFTHTQPITISISCKVNKWISGTELRIGVRDSRRNVFTTDTELITDNKKPEMIVAKAVIPGNLLRPETYFLTLAIYIPNQLIIDLIPDAFSVRVIDGGSKYAASEGLDYGCVFVDCAWTVEAELSKI
jgi:lipopolysaccharide transport system ATP-binding protein